MALSSQARMGLLAVAIVGGGTLLLGCVIGIVALSSGDKKGSGKGEGNKSEGQWTGRPKQAKSDILNVPSLSSSEKEDVEKIISHRWWRFRPSKEQLAQLIQFIGETNGTGKGVLIDDSGFYCRSVGTSREGTKNIPLPEDAAILGKRHFVYGLTTFAKEARDKVLLTLLSYLDDQTSDSFGRQPKP